MESCLDSSSQFIWMAPAEWVTIIDNLANKILFLLVPSSRENIDEKNVFVF